MRLRLPLHGRSHGPNGSDPIKEFLHWGTNNDVDDLGLILNSVNGYFATFLDYDITGTGSMVTDFSDQDASDLNQMLFAGRIHVESSTNDIELFTGGTGGVNITTSGGFFNVQGGGPENHDVGDFDLSAANVSISGAEVSVSATTSLVINLNIAGVDLTVKDSGGNPVFRVEEGGDVHIRTGTTIIADL